MSTEHSPAADFMDGPLAAYLLLYGMGLVARDQTKTYQTLRVSKPNERSITEIEVDVHQDPYAVAVDMGQALQGRPELVEIIPTQNYELRLPKLLVRVVNQLRTGDRTLGVEASSRVERFAHFVATLQFPLREVEVSFQTEDPKIPITTFVAAAIMDSASQAEILRTIDCYPADELTGDDRYSPHSHSEYSLLLPADFPVHFSVYDERPEANS